MPEDLYQLKLLWSGMKQAIEQKRQRLELIRDLWHSFEEKKEEFVVFLARAETRLREFPVTLAQAMDFGLIQKEIETQKVQFAYCTPKRTIFVDFRKSQSLAKKVRNYFLAFSFNSCFLKRFLDTSGN